MITIIFSTSSWQAIHIVVTIPMPTLAFVFWAAAIIPTLAVYKKVSIAYGAGCGVVDKALVSFTLEILSLVRFPAPPSKLLQAAVWSKRDYKAACISLLIPPPQQEATASHTDCFICTDLTNKPTYLHTNRQTNNTSGLPYEGLPAIHSEVYVSQDLCLDWIYVSDIRSGSNPRIVTECEGRRKLST